jgi:O-antigen/teichoic acid export membrane protein
MALRGATAELIGFGGMQVFRLVSTLILTRLLYPEAFGLATIVNLFIVGMSMLSDAGLEQSVVQNPRGDERAFLNTAWTIQITRGWALFAVACLCAWPMAWIYGEPQLFLMLIVGAIGLPLAGVASTSPLTLRRAVRLRSLIAMEFGTQVTGGAVMIAWAYYSPSVWAILGGSMVSAVMRTVWTHLIPIGYRNRIEWDPAAAREIFHFGKWIFGSSALAFISRQSDRLFVGDLAGMGVLGVYNIAAQIAEMVGQATSRITHGVWFPVLSRVSRETPDRLATVLYRARAATDALGLIPLGMMVVMAETLIEVLYDARYAEAGWMLRLLCVRIGMLIVLEPLQTCLFSLGHTRYGFLQNVARSVWLLIGIPVAWSMWGLQGLIWATAFAEIPVILLLWMPMARLGLLRLRREALALGFVAIGLVLGYFANTLIRSLLVSGGFAGT